MAVNKRTRYEVLRRDNYRCRYCGASADESPLTIDHVVPVSLGGSDDPSNLVAACKSCNAGKSSSSPDSSTVAQVASDAVRWAAAMRQAASELEAKVGARAKLIRAFDEAWRDAEAVSGTFPRPDDWQQGLASMLTAGLTINTATDLIDVAVDSKVNRYSVWRYFCGCAWRTVKDIRESAASIVHSSGPAVDAEAGPAPCGHCVGCQLAGEGEDAWCEVNDECHECETCGRRDCLYCVGYSNGSISGYSEGYELGVSIGWDRAADAHAGRLRSELALRLVVDDHSNHEGTVISGWKGVQESIAAMEKQISEVGIAAAVSAATDPWVGVPSA